MLKVMIVDDMDIVKRQIKRLKIWKEEIGFSITEEASNGEEAIRKLKVNPVDLVITDIKMPKIDGIELLKKINEMNLCHCTVLLSEYGEFSYARQGIIFGAFDYLLKPVNENELREVLVRIKPFILEKVAKDERIKKIYAIFNANDINKITEYIVNGDMKSVELIENIIVKADIVFDHNLKKIAVVLENVMQELIKITIDNYNWYDKFVNIEELIDVDFSGNSDIDSIKNDFIKIMKKIILKVNMFEFSNQKSEKIKQICKYVLENISNEISLDILSKRLYINKSYISEIFKQITGTTLSVYITMIKIERAKKIMDCGNLRTYEISSLLGYKDVEYFSRLFKNHTGVTPREFRKYKYKFE